MHYAVALPKISRLTRYLLLTFILLRPPIIPKSLFFSWTVVSIETRVPAVVYEKSPAESAKRVNRARVAPQS